MTVVEHHRAWAESDHADVFDYWRFIPRVTLRILYECFNEIRLLSDALRQHPAATVLEIGCATGELYRYLRTQWPRVRYVGADISEPALARAAAKYPAATFVRASADLREVRDAGADVVFCRDVVHHQPDPFVFLETLYGLAGRALVLRLRTRDRGPTERDPVRSCQYMYGRWAPYIVLNCDEVVEASRTYTPPPAGLTFLKHYLVLGGQHLRFLPKDCYDPATGTAETALLIEKGPPGGRPAAVTAIAAADGVSGWKVRLPYFVGRVAGRLLRGVLGRGYAGATWW